MAKINITATNVMSSSDAYRELFNRDGLQVYAMRKGRFQIKCGSTHKVVRNTQELQEGIDGLGLHQFPHSGESVVSEINEKLSSTYRLEVRASNDKVIHMIEGSKDKILGECIGTIHMDRDMVPGRRYACNGIFGGDYMILVPMSAGAMCLDDSFSTQGDQMYEKQEFAKGVIVIGQNPIDGSTMTVLVDEVYPNGAFKDSEGIVWAKEDIGVYKFEVGRPTTNEDFKSPSESLYTEEDIPTYNPVGDVAKSAPMINDLKNYDSILSASAGILSDFMKTAKGVAYIDRSSLNKVKISGINPEGQATDGEIEWNVRISSPHYKRSSNIMIPMVMKEGSIDLGKEFTASTGLKYPMTTEAIKEHLGTLIEDFEKKCRGSRYPSTLKADKDVDNLMNGVDIPKKTAGGEFYSDVVMQQEAIESSETKEEAVQKLKDMGYVSTFTEDMNSDKVETIEECVDRVWDLYKDPGNAVEGSKKTGEYQPKTGEPCSCKPGVQRDNCPACEGTGMKIDFKKIRDTNNTGKKTAVKGTYCEYADRKNENGSELCALNNYECCTKHFKNKESNVCEKRLEANGETKGSKKADLSPESLAQSIARGDSYSLSKVTDSNRDAIKAALQKMGHDEKKVEALLQQVASKKTAETSDNLVEYYFTIRTDLSEDDAKEHGLDTQEEHFWDAATDAALKVEQNVQMWMEQNVGHNTNEGHDNDGLVGSIYVERGSNGHKFVMSCLEDNHEEPARTSSGTLPFDPFTGIEDKFAGVIDVDLSFMRVTNQPPENTPDYSNEPEPDYKSFRGTGKEGYKKTSAITDFTKGTMVKPLRSKKHPESVWTKGFGNGKTYEVLGHDSLDGVDVLTLKTGEGETDYEVVYPDEVVKIGIEGSKKVIAFDFTQNQNLKVGDTVLVNGKTVKVTNLHRVQDVYSSEEDFNSNQDLYQNSGLTWEGNQIMSVDVDSDGLEVEHFVYELEKVGVEGSKKVAMEPGHGFQVEAEPSRYYTGTFTDWMNNGESVPFAVANADEIPPSSKDIRTTNANSSEEAIKVRFGSKKVATSVPDQHQLKILKDTVRNPNKGLFLGGPSAEESEQILRTKFNYTDKQIEQLKTGSLDKKADESDNILNAKTLDQLKAAVEAMGYTVDENDVIKDSGRFEAEHIATVFYNEGYMAGDQGEDFLDFGEGETYIYYKISPEEQKMFGTSEPYFLLSSSSQGFISGEFASEDRHQIGLAEYEKVETESGEEGMPVASKTSGAHTGWNVYLDGKWLDKVFYVPTADAEEVKQGLVEHDGYDSNITVKKEKSKTSASQAWDVLLDGKVIDTVWDSETDPAEVKRSLVGHDGYDPNIVVQKPQKKGSIKTAEVAEPDLAAFRENPDEFGVPAEIAQNWTDDEIKVYLEEKMFANEHFPALANKTAGGGAGIRFENFSFSGSATLDSKGETVNSDLAVVKFDAYGYEDGMSDISGKLLSVTGITLSNMGEYSKDPKATFEINIPQKNNADGMLFWGYQRLGGIAEGTALELEHVDVSVTVYSNDEQQESFESTVSIGLAFVGEDAKYWYEAVFGSNYPDDADVIEWIKSVREANDSPDMFTKNGEDNLDEARVELQQQSQDDARINYGVSASKTAALNPQAKYSVISTFNGTEEEMKAALPDINFDTEEFNVETVGSAVQVERIFDGSGLAEYLNKLKAKADKIEYILVLDLSEPSGAPMSPEAKQMEFDGWEQIEKNLLS